MRRSLIAVAATLAVIAAACGGDKKPAPTATVATPDAAARAAEIRTAAASRTPDRTATPRADARKGDALSGLFGTIFGEALSGSPDRLSSELGAGDPDLLKLLPPNSALPDGYTPMGSYTFRAPDGISETGGIDMAAEVAVAGAPESSNETPDFSKIGVLMALVMHPDDLQSLGTAFDSIRDLDPQQLSDAVTSGTGTNGLFTVSNVRTFETDGLGDGNAGIEMTIDLGGFGAIFGGLSGDATPEPGAPDLSNLKMTMRLYLFARGDYAGGLLRMAFADALPQDIDEVGLAKLIDANLRGAQ